MKLLAENVFFSLSDHGDYFEITRKTPTLPGALNEIFEVLTVLIPRNEKTVLKSPIEDYALFKDLQILGFTWNGYFEGSRPLPRQSFKGDGLLFECSDLKLLEIPIGHSLSEYRQFNKYRERLLLGFQSNQATFSTTSVPQHSFSRTQAKSAFEEKLKSRRSASVIKTSPTENELHTLLSQAFSGISRDPLAQAGGIDQLQIWAVTSFSVKGNSGLLFFDRYKDDFEPISDAISPKGIWGFGFQQTWASDCDCFLVFSIDPQKAYLKYGPRARRFGHMACGAALHQAQLVAHDLKLSSRHMGGFDDMGLQSYLGFPENYEIVACMGLGQSE